MTDFAEWFRSITGNDPFPYQVQLATQSDLPSLVDIPTGAGKTAAIVLGWLWRRHCAPSPIPQATPRRLVYCLPMRTLVEQTYRAVKTWLDQAQSLQYLTHPVTAHLLMGGSVANDWDTDPEQDCILIGTQDQLLSRALNRGYSMSRYRWPIHFALLNNDCLWVMDETQLMGAGLQTTAQLQGFREDPQFKSYGPVQSVWMSATLDHDVLRTINAPTNLDRVLTLSDEDKADTANSLKTRLDAQKPLHRADVTWDGSNKPSAYAQSLAADISRAHQPDRLTLVICNRVDRAQAIYQALSSNSPKRLIHSRFRPHDRQHQQAELQDFRGIVVATQAVEAGVDLDAAVLFTELAPWASLVQRFGRCNRRGQQNDMAQVYWIDIPALKKKRIALPYTADALEEARSLLESLEDVGYHALEHLRQEGKVPQEVPEGLIPRRHDLLQLFDTSTDLAGHDIDVSPFIRESNNTDVAIAWRHWEGNQPPSDMSALHPDELCRVPIGAAKDFLKKLSQQTPRQFAWMWDGMQGEWVQARSIYPGATLLLPVEAGGYDPDLGFTGNGKDIPAEVSPSNNSEQLDADNLDPLTPTGQYISLKQHAEDVAAAVQGLCNALTDYNFEGDRPDLVELLERSGRWHDAGKAHAVFQELLTWQRPDKQTGELWAKSDGRSNSSAKSTASPPVKPQIATERRGFRHELVSALMALHENEDFLLAYLVACHHGKVRLTIQPRPTESPPRQASHQDYALGVWEGDAVPEVDLGADLKTEAHTLSLACMRMGGKQDVRSWTEQAIALLDEFGPFKLAFLESIIRIADWRVSKRYRDATQPQEASNDS
jgi:CRISPR-associated endonuclease/helicase Cas3